MKIETSGKHYVKKRWAEAALNLSPEEVQEGERILMRNSLGFGQLREFFLMMEKSGLLLPKVPSRRGQEE